MKVLHVTETFTAGVKTAIVSYASSDVPVEHSVLWNSRRDPIGVKDPDPQLFDEVFTMPTGHLAAIREVRKVAKEFKPDVIHGHSSFGGVYARVGGFLAGVPVVYTPHGLSFERQDISGLKKTVFRTIEKVLSRVTTVFAGCSTDESNILTGLNSKVPAIRIPNALTDQQVEEIPRWQPGEYNRICFTGRISPQRDPATAAQIAKLAAPLGIEAIWVGDGDEELRALLEDAGVKVTGWKDKEQFYEEIRHCDVAIHTSLWDGFPMTVLEYVAMGIPTAVADIQSLFECPAQARFSTPEEAVEIVKSVKNGSNGSNWSSIEQTYNSKEQSKALLDAYEKAVSARKT